METENLRLKEILASQIQDIDIMQRRINELNERNALLRKQIKALEIENEILKSSNSNPIKENIVIRILRKIKRGLHL